MVTGDSRGIGRAIAHALSVEGMYLSLCARTQQMLTEAVAALTYTGSVPRPAMGFVGDITEPGNAEKWVDETVKKFGGIDVLVNNAGTARPGALAGLPASATNEQFGLS